MRKIIIVLSLLQLLILPAKASDFTPPEVPNTAQHLMPDQTESFGQGLWYILSEALRVVQPSLTEAVETCVGLVAVTLLIGLFSELSGNARGVIAAIGTVTIGVILFQPVNTFIEMGTQTVQEISQYGKLLLPVMTSALAAQGAVSRSGAVYLATALLDTFLSTTISGLLIPIVYLFLCISITVRVFSQPLILQIQRFLKWVIIWGLKTVLYVFTGYISVTGVVAGTTDAAMLKATKLTISGMVPVVGNIISDASEAVLVSAGIMKNAVGVYGLLAIMAIWIGPFLQIGIQYLLLKLTAGITEMFAAKQMSELIKDFSTAMGLVLAMTGTVCLLFLISTICFLKGAG